MVTQTPVCMSATCGKPDGPVDSPTWTHGSRSFVAHRHGGGRHFFLLRSSLIAPIGGFALNVQARTISESNAAIHGLVYAIVLDRFGLWVCTDRASPCDLWSPTRPSMAALSTKSLASLGIGGRSDWNL